MSIEESQQAASDLGREFVSYQGTTIVLHELMQASLQTFSPVSEGLDQLAELFGSMQETAATMVAQAEVIGDERAQVDADQQRQRAENQVQLAAELSDEAQNVQAVGEAGMHLVEQALERINDTVQLIENLVDHLNALKDT